MSTPEAKPPDRRVDQLLADAAARHRRRKIPRKPTEPQQLALFDLPARRPRHDRQDQHPA
ncbi:hypothetical protein [Nocardia cyriacigeorgica]|uniref:hypothetical protein n=1 Tax=Nocardia cyriacigeorgica TaxID=135487 RepID=UPI0018961FF0|nr:hypothetical protein [Nocardia cyriacigeorgica]MBF6413415.1 hypothetical protein [Nocardia cyriacigeorgica]